MFWLESHIQGVGVLYLCSSAWVPGRCTRLRVLGIGTCGGLYLQLLHPPKQCHVGGSLHAQPERTSRDHRLSVPFCVPSNEDAMSVPFHQCMTYHKSCKEPYRPRLSYNPGALGPSHAQATVTVFYMTWSKFGCSRLTAPSVLTLRCFWYMGALCGIGWTIIRLDLSATPGLRT